MHSQISEISPVEVEVTVEVPWERVQRELDSTYSMLGRTARVRGFRPGKAPRPSAWRSPPQAARSSAGSGSSRRDRTGRRSGMGFIRSLHPDLHREPAQRLRPGTIRS